MPKGTPKKGVEKQDPDFEIDDPAAVPGPSTRSSTSSRKKPVRGRPPRKKAKADENEVENLAAGIIDDEEDDENEDLINVVIPERRLETTLGTRERLIIHKVIVSNFKSYYGTKVLGPFHKSFTAIMGPNGSGKSNIIDALLFVFGFRSTKIRSRNVFAMVHKSARNDCTFCSVEIEFLRITDIDEDHFTYRPSQKIVVARTVNRESKSSKYTINGISKTQKEVEDQLNELGIDLIHNRFLILQGEVEAIALMKPKGNAPGDEGMLEYLEDIIGSSRFMPYIVKLDRRLHNIQMKLHLLQMSEKTARDAALKIQPLMEKSLAYMRKENEATILRSKIYQFQSYTLNMQLEPFEAQLNAKKHDMVESIEKQKELLAKIEEIDIEDKALVKSKEEALKTLDEAKKRYDEADLAERRRRMVIKTCSTDLVRLKKEAEAEQKKKDELLLVPDTATRRIEILKNESREFLEREDQSNKRVSENLDKFEIRSGNERKKRRNEEAELAKRNGVLDDVKAKITIAEAELADLRTLADQDRLRLGDMNRNRQQVEDKLNADTCQLEFLSQQLPVLEDEHAVLEHDLAGVRAEEFRLNNELRTLRHKYEMDLQTFNSQLQGSRTFRALKEAADRNEIFGFVGRLGDLGDIDKRYDVAISTIVAPLDFFVVETKEDGQACIDYLTANGLPRSTFLIIDQIPSFDDLIDRTDFPLPRLFDLVRMPNPIHRKVFYQSMGDLLVAENLQQAQAVDKKYKKFRIVDLQGNMIDTTGSVSGGGKPLSGRIGLKIRATFDKKTLDAMNAQLEVLQTQHADVLERMQTIEQRMIELRELPRLREERRQLETGIPLLRERLAVIKRTLATLEKDATMVRVDPRDLELRQAMIDGFYKERDEAVRKVEMQKEKVNEIIQRIDRMFNSLVQKHKDDAKSARESYAVAEQAIARESASIHNFDRNIERVDERLRELTRMINIKQNEFIELSEAEHWQKDILNCGTQIENLQKQLFAHEEKFKELRRRRLEKSDEEVVLDAKVTDLRMETALLQEQIANAKMQIRKTAKLMETLKLEKIPVVQLVPPEQPARYWMPLAASGPLLGSPTGSVHGNDDDDGGADADQRLPVMTEDELKATTADEAADWSFQVKQCEQQLDEMRTAIDVRSIDEFIEKKKVYDTKREATKREFDVYTAHRDKLHELKTRRRDEFNLAFACISGAVRELYQMITVGGDATLESGGGTGYDPFSSGVSFMVRPAKKSWKAITNLSGGEKTLASLALVFALHHYRPTPLYVMDEIDAALDYRNVNIIARYIKERTRNAQFIIISLRNQLFAVANRWLGIYKINDETQHVILYAVNDEAKIRAFISHSLQLRILHQQSDLATVAAAAPLRESTVETSDDDEPKGRVESPQRKRLRLEAEERQTRRRALPTSATTEVAWSGDQLRREIIEADDDEDDDDDVDDDVADDDDGGGIDTPPPQKPTKVKPPPLVAPPAVVESRHRVSTSSRDDDATPGKKETRRLTRTRRRPPSETTDESDIDDPLLLLQTREDTPVSERGRPRDDSPQPGPSSRGNY